MILRLDNMKKIKNIYFKYLALPKSSWNFFLKSLFMNKSDSICILREWETSSKIIFSPKKYSEILQMSFIKDYHDLSNYLLSNKTFVYPFADLPPLNSKINMLDKLMTNNLLKIDHGAWLGLMACHHPFHLLKIDNMHEKYDFQEYFPIVKKFFFHPSFKDIYMSKSRRNLMISHCPTNATKMLFRVFMELDLTNGMKKVSTVTKI